MAGFPAERVILVTWSDWSAGTAVAGAGNISKARSPLGKICWGIIFMVGLVFTVVSVSSVILSYRQYGVYTSIGVKQYSR